MLDTLTTFDFEDHAVRVIQRDGDPWFVAADVCRVLGLGNTSQAVSRLDDDEKGIIQNDTLGGAQQMLIVSESGFYAMVVRSDKPEAKRFRKWVTSVVLPSIRKTGRYDHAAPRAEDDLGDVPLRESTLWMAMIREIRLLEGPGAARRMWAQSPLPKVGPDPVDNAQEISAIPAFLSACCEVTGNPRDLVRTSDLCRAFRRWADLAGAEPMPERTFYKRLSAMAGRWRCPVTGKRMGRVKSSNPYVSGLVLVAGA